MNPIQNLYFALGELAYAIAKADGTIQKEEKQMLHDIVTEEVKKNHNIDFDYSEIIFTIMGKDNTDSESSYEWALHEMKLNSHYLKPELKVKFQKILEKVAEAFPPVTPQEQKLLDRFQDDLKTIN